MRAWATLSCSPRPAGWEKPQSSGGRFIIKGANPSMAAPPPPQHPPEASRLRAITWGLGVQPMNPGGHRHSDQEALTVQSDASDMRRL